MEENKPLELRMYFFVPYNISPIQQAIQAGHASLEYALKYGNTGFFKDFVKNWKTWIILNGGTTNCSRDLDGISMGTLNQIGDDLITNEILFSYFNEPDLNNALTAVCFICDERVWNREDYPDFIDYLINSFSGISDPRRDVELRMMTMEGLIFQHTDKYMEWVEFLGGKKNVFLRELIKGKKLA